MKKLAKKLIENNLSLKIFSVLIAIVLWLLVTNIDDPSRTISYNGIPISITNGSYLESMGLTCTLSQTNTVKVSIRGTRSIVDNISMGDIVVTADLTQIVSLDSSPVMVPITASCPKYPNLSSNNITTYPTSIALEVEDIKSESFVVIPSTDGTKPVKEYEVGEMQPALEQITITGPTSLINKIDKVLAKVNVTNLDESTTLSGSIAIYDKNQDQISGSQLNYLKIKELPETYDIDVKVNLWRIKKDVLVQVGTFGTPKPGYQIGEVEVVPSTVSVVGTESALDLLEKNGNTILIPDTEVDVSGKSDDFITKIDINQFLPDNIRLATDVSSNVLITTTILPDGSRAFQIPISNITQLNLPENMMVSYTTDRIEVRIKGSATTLNAIKEDEITGSIDLTGLGVGQHTVLVELNLASGLQLVTEAMVDILISELELTTKTTSLDEEDPIVRLIQ